jgi:hypothetical protein
MMLVAAGGGRQQWNAFWEIQFSTFHFLEHLEQQAEKEHRRRNHVYFSRAIFQL